MKLIAKTTLLAFAMSSTLTYAETAKYQACKNVKGGKNCYALQISIPQYAYPWLTNFAISRSVEGFDFQSENLAGIVEEVVKDTLSTANTPDNAEEKVIWQPLEEGNGYLQLIQEESSYSSRNQEKTNLKTYYLFHRSEPLFLLSVENVLIDKNSLQKLEQVLKSSYVDWQRKNIGMSRKDAIEIANAYLKKESITSPSNWWFGKNKMVFSYSEREIGPAVYGKVTLQIPIQKLTGILKPNVIKAVQQWQSH